MLTWNSIDTFDLNSDLIESVRSRVESGHYSDAISAGFKFLSNTLREKGNSEGDGASLVGQVLGGQAPAIRLNLLQTTSEKDEQKGIEQLVRGLYIGIRNPRSHENFDDDEDFCIRIIVLIDTVLGFLNPNVSDFDIEEFVCRIYDPHFVSTTEYAEVLVAPVPATDALTVFQQAFYRRQEGNGSEIKYVFHALYQKMTEANIAEVMSEISSALRNETETSDIAEIFRLFRKDMWQLLDEDVRMRMENLIISACQKGRYNAFGGLQAGGIGSWGNRYGKYFSQRKDLADILIRKLNNDWYTQNYVGKYYLRSLPVIIRGKTKREEAANALTYALLINKANILRNQFKKVCSNYPERWKESLRISIQEESDSDTAYSEEILELLQ